MKKWAILCLAGLLLLSACSRSKDIMAVAGIESLDNLTITDRVGTQARVQNVEPFEEAFGQAVATKNGDELQLSLLDADYRLEANDATFYFFEDDGYLVYQDGKKHHIYEAELTALIAGVFASLPDEPSVAITEGAPSQEIEELAAALAQVDTPVAYLLDYDGKSVFIFAAGEQDTAYITVSVDKTTETGRGFIVDFTILTPASPAEDDGIYPYAILTFSETVHAIARTTEGSQVKEWPTISMQEGQQVALIQPRSGSLLTQRVTLRGKASVPTGRLQVEIEDGHQILAQEEIILTAPAPQWGDFDVTLDLDMPTNLSGTIIFFTESDGVRQEELVIPVLFTGGK